MAKKTGLIQVRNPRTKMYTLFDRGTQRIISNSKKPHPGIPIRRKAKKS